MATKKTKKSVTSKASGAFQLGNPEDDSGLNRGLNPSSSSGCVKPSNLNGDNIFLICSPDYFVLQEHWFTIADGDSGKTKRMSYPCGVHSLEVPEVGEPGRASVLEQIVRGFAPDQCPFCDRSMRLFREAKNDDKDPLNSSKKKLAEDLRYNTSFLLIAIPGKANISNVGGKRIVSPYFDSPLPDPVILSLTPAAFKTLSESRDKSNLSSVDLVGMPCNFYREIAKKNKYSMVQSVQFFPKNRVGPAKLPSNYPDFSEFGKFDADVAEELIRGWDERLDLVLEEIEMDGQSESKRGRKQ